MALATYGVLADGSFASLASSYRTHVENAIDFLLSTQDTTSAPGPNSSFGDITNIGYPTYETGIALLGLSYFQSVNPGIAAEIADAREFLVNEFEGPTNDGCSASDAAVATTASWCGGWNYDPDDTRSDESNSGYAMTGLAVTGGIPNVSQSDETTLIQDNIDWNHHIQVISSNPFTLTANAGTGGDDGGGSYQPAYAQTQPNYLASNANNSGTMLFSYADDGIAMGDPDVTAAIKFDEDVLNSYELEQANVGPASMQMIYHAGATEDGSCTPDVGTCDWFADSDGGYHYSQLSAACRAPQPFMSAKSAGLHSNALAPGLDHGDVELIAGVLGSGPGAGEPLDGSRVTEEHVGLGEMPVPVVGKPPPSFTAEPQDGLGFLQRPVQAAGELHRRRNRSPSPVFPPKPISPLGRFQRLFPQDKRFLDSAQPAVGPGLEHQARYDQVLLPGLPGEPLCFVSSLRARRLVGARFERTPKR